MARPMGRPPILPSVKMPRTGIEFPISQKTTLRLQYINGVYCTRLVFLNNFLAHGLDAHPGLLHEGLDLVGARVEASTASRQLHGDGHREVGHSEGVVIATAGSRIQNVGGTAHGVLGTGGFTDGIRTSLGHLIVVAPAAGKGTTENIRWIRTRGFFIEKGNTYEVQPQGYRR